MDAILTADGPSYIDVNPRLVEPMNARRAGVDLVEALLRVSAGETPQAFPQGRPDVMTHQLVLAIVAAAAHGRMSVVRELIAASTRSDAYRSSTEELTPLHRDLRSAVPVLLIALALLVKPGNAKSLARGAVANYAIGSDGWRTILRLSGRAEH
jgi:hypothetical protein